MLGFRYTPAIALGKLLRKGLKLRGGGSALPGLVTEMVAPHLLAQVLGQLPQGVIVVTGTNGKTTTTKILVELLSAHGLRVISNPTGSNFSRGIMSALLGSVDLRGRLDADIAVLEIDEAHAVSFVHVVQPRVSLLLNVMRDQMDRYGEMDRTTQMLRAVAVATRDVLVLNVADPRLGSAGFLRGVTARVSGFGISDRLRHLYAVDDELTPDVDETPPDAVASPATMLEEVGQTSVVSFGGRTHEFQLPLDGFYNQVNGVAAVAACRAILGASFDPKRGLAALPSIVPAFGRGETLVVDGQEVQLVLVKNPGGFRAVMTSFTHRNVSTMIALNDLDADGRDVSWIWDVDFSPLRDGVDVVTGTRADDLSLRLNYDEVPCAVVERNPARALRVFLARNPGELKRIYCTYTAMLALRRILRLEALGEAA
ncbi:MAG: hypothetical protein QOF36_2499 [Microbacteriaceae bacterium]|nr:hypothetical protein [Microbacteriaceae bacterium]